jgi:hypothetical protein
LGKCHQSFTWYEITNQLAFLIISSTPSLEYNTQFQTTLSSQNKLFSPHPLFYPMFHNCILGGFKFMTSVHSLGFLDSLLIWACLP